MRDPIKATLIYNPAAGSSSRFRPPDLFKLFKAVGIKLNHRKTEEQADIARVMPDSDEPVVVVGGDGTVRAVIEALLGRSNPVIILPGGSANNIARSFGLGRHPIPHLVQGLADPIRRPINVGLIEFPWDERLHFVEGVGFGLFADLLARYDPEQGKSLGRGLQAAMEEFSSSSNYATRLQIDDIEIEAVFRMVEVLNTPAVGPRLTFAPEASMTSGKFGVVIADSSVNAAASIPALLAHRFAELEGVRTEFGETVSFDWTDFAIHVDQYIHPSAATLERLGPEPPPPGPVKIRVKHDAVTLWLPNLSEDNASTN